MKKSVLFLGLLLVCLSAAGVSGFPGFQNRVSKLEKIEAPLQTEAKEAIRHWKIDGVEREALLFAPPSSTSKSPLIFAFHGHGGTMRHAARTFGYQNIWKEAIVIYMQGLPTPGALSDPEGKKPGWQKTAGDQNDRDLKFFDAALSTLKKEFVIDDKRIFAAGHSNGGAFTFLLWAERGKNFAAMAPASAVASWSMTKLTPKPAIQLGGENDRRVRYQGQVRTMDYIRKMNACDATGKEWAKSGSLTGTLYASKRGNPFVALITPGGHMFPTEAPDLIVKFFKECTASGKE